MVAKAMIKSLSLFFFSFIVSFPGISRDSLKDSLMIIRNPVGNINAEQVRKAKITGATVISKGIGTLLN